MESHSIGDGNGDPRIHPMGKANLKLDNTTEMVSNGASTLVENTFNFRDALLKKLLDVNIGIVDEVGDDDLDVKDFDGQDMQLLQTMTIFPI